MKIFSKPISSPSRVEQFPPPLLRFLRSNGGNKSRGRSRSSPMFIRKKTETENETQEPYSPKVTCMGKVRVRRSKKSITTKPRFRCIRKALFCNSFDEKQKPRSSRPFWRKWFVFLQMGYRRKVKIKETKREESEEEEDDTEDEEVGKVFVSSSPPKNALLLMRCRSEPYRASSLANRLWGSPLEDKTEQKDDHPTLRTEPSYRDSEAESITEPQIEEKLGFCEGLESSSNETSSKTTNIVEEKSKIERSPARPLILTRCKSEPARRLTKKRLGFVDISPDFFD